MKTLVFYIVWILRVVKRTTHWLEHKLRWNVGTVETWWQGDVMWVGFKCATCGKVSYAYPFVTERTK